MASAAVPDAPQNRSADHMLAVTTAVILPFFAFYAAWGFLGDTVREYSRMALNSVPFGEKADIFGLLRSRGLVASIVAQGCWIALRSALAVGEQPKFGFGAPLEGKNLVVELGNFLPALGGGALAPYATGPATLPVYAVATALAIGGCVGLALTAGLPAMRRFVGVSTVVVAVVAAPALAIVVGFVENNYVPLPSRYAHSLLPWALLSAGLLVGRPRPWVRYTLLGLGVVTWCLALMMGEAG